MTASRLLFGPVLLMVVLAGFVARPATVPARADETRAPGGRPAILEGRDTTPVPLRVGPHRFRIPRNYFLNPPHHSGVDDGFGLRALMPDMAPMTDANRHVFLMSSATEEGGRVVRILFEIMAERPRDDARWRLGNVLRSSGAAQEDFAPPS